MASDYRLAGIFYKEKGKRKSVKGNGTGNQQLVTG